MAHDPRPHGAFQEGGPASDEDAGVAAHLLKRLQAIKTAGDLPSHKMVRDLPGGGQVIAQDMGGIVKTIIMKPEQQQNQLEPIEPPSEEIESDRLSIPILFSGRIMTPSVPGNDPVKVRLTRDTLRRLRSYDDEKEDGAEEQSLYRFRVGYHAVLSEFTMGGGTFTEPPMLPTMEVVTSIHPILGPVKQMVYAPRSNWVPPPPAPINSDRFRTQYSDAIPTWWSGAMAEVVQIVSGFGMSDPNKLPEEERVKLTIPEAVRVKMESEKEHINVRLPGYRGVPPLDGQLRFDYKFFQTDVVSFDNENRPWLVRIKSDGVWAMPLPMIPATTTETFKKWMGSGEDWSVGDAEITHILERFGGIPSGESMPFAQEDFQAWKRAGVISKVCEVGDFHEHIMYSSACGWSVNSKGTEGFNTCYDYDDNGFGVGFSYKLRLNMGAADFDGKLPEGLSVDDPEDSALLSEYLSGLYRQLREPKAKNLAIKYKLRREGAEKILARAQSNDGAGDVDYWDNLELSPIATHSGSITQVGKGNLYHPSKFEFNPQIKFPEPFLDGCISHDFRALRESAGKPKPKCDTVVFGYYVGDELKTVKYFWEPRSTSPKEEGEIDPCSGEGSRTTTSAGRLLPNFYTSDFDDRKTTPGSSYTYSATLSDLGFFEWMTIPPAMMDGILKRNRAFLREASWELSESISADAGLCIPFYSRNALLYAHKELTGGGSSGSGRTTMEILDPNQYAVWTYDKYVHWIGEKGKQHNAKPFPKDGRPVWAEVHIYTPGGCSDLADEGDWLGGLPRDVTGRGTGGGIDIYDSESEKPEDPKDERKLHLSIIESVVKPNYEKVDDGYFISSPDPTGGIFMRYATMNVCGDAEYGIVSEPFGVGVTKWGNSNYADDKSIPRFIGVINE